MIIDRQWAMPSPQTFSIPPIKSLINKYVEGKECIIDPFANGSRIATITNDLDESYDTDYHMDAEDFLQMFSDQSVDVVLYDPPYTPRQVAECYKRLGRTVNMETTQSSYWRKQKDEIGRIVKPDGIVISCGWNSGGIGKKRGFDIIEVLLVPHGSNHNDTIVTVERKLQVNKQEERRKDIPTQMRLWGQEDKP